jgi:two-component system, repressor protein LuxO
MRPASRRRQGFLDQFAVNKNRRCKCNRGARGKVEAVPTILIVEDTESMARLYRGYLGAEPFSVNAVASLAAARAILARQRPVALLLDVNLPDGSGIDLLREIRTQAVDTAVIVMTAYGSIGGAVDAMRGGADDFLVKPFAPERLITTLNHVLERRRLTRIVTDLAPGLSEDSFAGFIGADLSMQAIYRIIQQAARSQATVFIAGESGTGKEICAEAIHSLSTRSRGPFVPVNCGAIPKELLESEIFGHVKGAFTGAHAERDGAAARAHGGTLFFDEICELDIALQVKLLRFVQTGMVKKLGSDSAAKADVRIICATNRDPATELETGRFREDLFYRLHVVPIELPPLRERGRDVLLLARHFLARFSREEGRRFSGFSREAEEILLRGRWPGNVRQVENLVRNVTVLHDGELVLPDMLPPGLTPEPTPVGQAELRGKPVADVRPLAVIEREAIEAAIAACGGNLTEAATRLGINVSTIHRKRQAWLAAGA